MDMEQGIQEVVLTLEKMLSIRPRVDFHSREILIRVRSQIEEEQSMRDQVHV